MAPLPQLTPVLLGHDEALPPLTGHRLVTAWQWEPWAIAGLLLAAGLYLAGVATLRRRGVSWPVGRSVAFLAGGIGTLAVALLSPLGTYDDTLFTVHMVQHMLLVMVVPVFLALGAPVTLLLRVARRDVRRVAVALLRSRASRLVSWPPLAWAHVVALPFVLYNSGWYEATLRSDTLHQWLHLQFVVAGCLFFWPLLGLDPMPHRIGYPARMLLTFLMLPAHAILGLSIMIQRHLIAGDFYAALHRDWGPTLQADQNTAGAVLWASGDLVGLLLFGVMFAQWQRADERTARRDDRRLARQQAQPAWAVPPATEPEAADRPSAEPALVRPWWEVDPGPLAERMRRDGWRRGGEG